MLKNINRINFSIIIFPFLLISICVYFKIPSKFFIKSTTLIKNIELLMLIKTNKCKIPKLNEIPANSSIIIGHLYGSPYYHNDFIDKKAEKFLLINKRKIKNLFLTGDVFAIPSKEKWSKLYNLLNKDMKILIAPGNHDIGDIKRLKIFNESVKQIKDFPIIFEEDNNVFILENSIESGWHIQEKTLKEIEMINQNDTVFLLRHNIAVKDLIPLANSRALLQKGLNDFKEMNNLFKRNVIVISGDGGAFKKLPRFFCRSYKNSKYIINGLGGIKGDEVLVIHNNQLFRYVLN